MGLEDHNRRVLEQRDAQEMTPFDEPEPKPECEFKEECEEGLGNNILRTDGPHRCWERHEGKHSFYGCPVRKFGILAWNVAVVYVHDHESAVLGELHHPRLDRILALKMDIDEVD